MSRPYREQRRHPVCPQCGFDVAGSLDARGTRCPECGCRFSPAELRRPGQSVFCIVIWIASLVAGVPLGLLFALRLFEAAGLVSTIVPVSAVLTMPLALAAGVTIHATYHATHMVWSRATAAMALGASITILRVMLPECWI